jgi:hypothetical protein
VPKAGADTLAVSTAALAACAGAQTRRKPAKTNNGAARFFMDAFEDELRDLEPVAVNIYLIR